MKKGEKRYKEWRWDATVSCDQVHGSWTPSSAKVLHKSVICGVQAENVSPRKREVFKRGKKTKMDFFHAGSSS